MCPLRSQPHAAVSRRAAEFSEWLITEKLIATVPWDEAGAYVRFSVTFEAKDEADERRVIAEVQRRLTSTGLVFRSANLAWVVTLSATASRAARHVAKRLFPARFLTRSASSHKRLPCLVGVHRAHVWDCRLD